MAQAPSVPDVSVVMPTYNGRRWLTEAVDSVLTQTGVDFELVIADHGSSDGTADLVDQIARSHPGVRVVHLPPGGGAEAGWNGATQWATGTFVKLLCQDDTLLPGTLARQAQLLRDHPGAALTACRRHLVDAEGQVVVRDWGLQRMARPFPGEAAVRRAVMLGINPFGEPGCVMTRTSLLRRVGFWDGRRPYVIDLSTYLRILEHGDFVPDPETGATFRVSDQQLSFRLRRTQAGQVTAMHREVLAHLPAWRRTPLLMAGSALAHAAQTGRHAVYVAQSLRRGGAS